MRGLSIPYSIKFWPRHPISYEFQFEKGNTLPSCLISRDICSKYPIYHLRIGSCLACVYRVMDARRKCGEHERNVRVARGDSRVRL